MTGQSETGTERAPDARLPTAGFEAVLRLRWPWLGAGCKTCYFLIISMSQLQCRKG